MLAPEFLSQGEDIVYPTGDCGIRWRAVHLRVAAVENIGQWAKAWPSDAACGKKVFGL